MYPIDYIEPVFRPPSEWQSLILQVTNGCSWNRCTFCDMYTQEQKRFRPKPLDEIEAELKSVAEAGYPVRRVFLADGDAMSLSMRRLKAILSLVNAYYPNVQRISSYCLPRNLVNKSVEDLLALRAMGLSLLYVGCESGDNDVLTFIDKGETYQSSLAALQKARQAGIKSSVMILNGLGGAVFSEQHALASARLMNEAQPDYLSTLVVNFPPGGEERFAEPFNGRWQKMTQRELFSELALLLEHLTLRKTIFRSDHISNTLVLKGVLGRDKQPLLDKIHAAIHRPELMDLRPERDRAI